MVIMNTLHQSQKLTIVLESYDQVLGLQQRIRDPYKEDSIEQQLSQVVLNSKYHKDLLERQGLALEGVGEITEALFKLIKAIWDTLVDIVVTGWNLLQNIINKAISVYKVERSISQIKSLITNNYGSITFSFTDPKHPHYYDLRQYALPIVRMGEPLTANGIITSIQTSLLTANRTYGFLDQLDQFMEAFSKGLERVKLAALTGNDGSITAYSTSFKIGIQQVMDVMGDTVNNDTDWDYISQVMDLDQYLGKDMKVYGVIGPFFQQQVLIYSQIRDNGVKGLCASIEKVRIAGTIKNPNEITFTMANIDDIERTLLSFLIDSRKMLGLIRSRSGKFRRKSLLITEAIRDLQQSLQPLNIPAEDKTEVMTAIKDSSKVFNKLIAGFAVTAPILASKTILSIENFISQLNRAASR